MIQNRNFGEFKMFLSRRDIHFICLGEGKTFCIIIYVTIMYL